MQEIEHVMTTGNLNRSTGYNFTFNLFKKIIFIIIRATNMNEHSSRSHAIFIITVESSEVIIQNLFFCFLENLSSILI